MKKTTNIVFFILMFSSIVSYGQVQLSRQVIGSTGGYSKGTNLSLSSTVGETSTQTLFSTGIILTQGFQQPQLTSDSILNYEVINESCLGAKNGSIYINSVLGCREPYTLIIKAAGDSINELSPDTLGAGDYDVVVIGANGCSYSTTLNVGLDSDEDCLLKFYSGITPNGDGVNDNWWIDNIELFPENTVQIFNRWGHEIWFGENYDNKNVVWQGNNNSNKEIADGTYFYVAKVAGKTYKGWVELTR